ncbi:MAG: cyclic beta 1-2 glucan synthetase [Desulfobacteraceae bacterium IS3]|nr:MAG: cyclic beta 1-2 glucan synthetase [Desulfobacteraceae bacterium IS3]
MKNHIPEKLFLMWGYLLNNTFGHTVTDEETPLRAELFSRFQMEQHGKTLAGLHTLYGHNVPEQLLKRLAANEKVLTDVRDILIGVVKENRKITPAGEWLLDNFYLIEEQIRVAKRLLPKGYANSLPHLKDGTSKGLPRVYDIALETISHGDGRADTESLSSFVAAYQTVTTLRLGELWAIPIMLRLALIENLRRVAARIAIDRNDRNLAGYWADRISETAEKDPKNLIITVADMARSAPPMVSSFIAELARRLQGQGAALALPLTWIEQHLSESYMTIAQMVQSENQQQAADQLSISNSIGSLRFLSAMDWRQFVDTMSAVEQTLREDPAGIYDKMDFTTRDQYRHVVEEVAKKSRLSEKEVAIEAVGLAQQASEKKSDEYYRANHVGFYLIDKGIPRLKARARVRSGIRDMLQRAGHRIPLPLYLGKIFLFTAIFAAVLLTAIFSDTMDGPLLWFAGVLSVVSVSQIAVAMVNLFATCLSAPRPLPRMDFSKGIPPEYSALVVVPTMLTSAENIGHLMDSMEVRFLANRDENLRFGLLTDFRDAVEENLPGDEALLLLARQRIEELNARYKDKGDIFFLFHRNRQWNQSEQIWMGYERKRGKLAELNLLLRGGSGTGFSLIVGNTEELSGVKYVITLDTDTEMPRDSAWQLVGAMAHPLNRPHYDGTAGRIVSGYGILQPRVSVSLPGANRSLYARLWGSDAGIDPYTRVVSDLYQDLFGQGSFIGKGIYDVDAFEQVLRGRFPENRILSHDLIEGCYVRSGLISDVQLYEAYPSRYSADVSRRRRWIRGDWQILRWLFPGVPGPDAFFRKNPLSSLSRWKIADNLRRSLVPIAMCLLLLLGWGWAGSPRLCTASVIAVVLIPDSIACFIDIFRKSEEALMSRHLFSAAGAAGRSFAQSLFMLICLPYEAFFSGTAILQTLWRMTVSGKGLLEWNPSGDADLNGRTDLAGSYRSMWIAPVIAVAATACLFYARPEALPAAAAVLILWFVSPLIAWWISRPFSPRKAKLTEDQTVFLRKLSRRTWAFFETFVGPGDHWLPPDNYQEEPLAAVAHRTSPTNMGLALLSNLSAYDFGYISAGQLIDRTAKALRTMDSLERYRGHFYNWYDTESLKPLLPKYVSSVDSGNLAACLMTLRAGLLALPDEKPTERRLSDGIADTAMILADIAGDPVPAELVQLTRDMEAMKSSLPDRTLSVVRQCLVRLHLSAGEAAAGLKAADMSDAAWWARSLSEQCRAADDDLTMLEPWIHHSPPADQNTDFTFLTDIPTLRRLACLDDEVLPLIGERRRLCVTPDEKSALDRLRGLIIASSLRARERIAVLEELARQCGELALSMEYGFLYDETRHLLSIGYNASEGRRDGSYYDLLASEARLTNFVAIAQGQLPQESWFALGRLLTIAGGEPVLLSWSGSMFEYLMPLLLMPIYEQTLLDQTCKAAVARQIAYGKKRKVPWGISESAYNMTDSHLNYQYKAFGVPGLGLRRGLAGELVVAPYASALALMVAPEEACQNLENLDSQGFQGKYGFYDAVDYTPIHLPHGQTSAVIRSFMAHHQGMSLLSFAYLLLGRHIQKRFESDPMFQATLLLLQERLPKATAFYSQTAGLSEIHTGSNALKEKPVRIFTSPDTPVPEVQLLSNGRYHVMISNAGGGYSRWKDLAVTRWREDSTCDNWGAFCYIRNIGDGVFWSTAYQPAIKPSKRYEAIFSEGRAEFRRRDDDFDTHTEIAVSPEDDIELRRITVTNRSKTRRTVDITSYAEIVLSSPAADALHPAFGNLFVQTEIIRHQGAIIATRRPRSGDEQPPWMFHSMSVHGADTGEMSYETDRLRFIGRGNTPAAPEAMKSLTPLSGSEGPVLDPVAAIRCQISLDPETSATVNIVLGAGETRDVCSGLVGKYRDRYLADRVFELAWTHSQVLLRQINATEADAQLYGRLAASVLYANSAFRAGSDLLRKNLRGQSGLWGYSISGDLPIVLLRIRDQANITLVRQLIQAHAYWRLKGLAVDLVIWNEDHVSYRQGLNDQIMGFIASGAEVNMADQPGGIFVRNIDQISEEDRVLFQSAARVIISDSMGTLAEQLEQRFRIQPSIFKIGPAVAPTRTVRSIMPEVPAIVRSDLKFFNGIGGFTPDGREYIISTRGRQVTPAPWVNVLANPHFGTVVSENGPVYTWSGNAHEFRLTPWNNDPVSDSGGEAFYIRDEESGYYWSPMPHPAKSEAPYITRHGFGYTVFEHTERGISSEVWVYVAVDASVKFTVFKVRNRSGRPRQLSVCGYAEWVLGDIRHKTVMHIITEVEPQSGAILARNRYNAEFGNRVAFFNVDHATRTISADRTEFLGRNGSPARPAAMSRTRLSGRTGAALDPCAAIHVTFELADREEREIVFTLGAGQDAADAAGLAGRFRNSAAARKALEAVWQYWHHTLSAVRVETPDPAVNFLANGWLIYQTIACRLWGRSGYYQSGGAFGFRDQLQDTMSLVHTEPRLVREHLLLCAGRQFSEGDVQHWWHPPAGRGVRTNCSDDFLWLPLATCRYVKSTGDTGILDEIVPFIKGRPVNPEEDSYYDLPGKSEQTASLYEHCVRAVKRGLRFGGHGLPLIGSGDWNDGMNMVGQEGRGESVWLAFFLYDVLIRFSEIAQLRGDGDFGRQCENDADRLRQSIARHGWDGEWYLRAYFDDGTPLGSSQNPECRIDSIAQSWSVLSGAGDAGHSRMAMDALDKYLVRRDDALIQLLDPPFDKSDLNPGYIKGYVPGVRENGGQYTHAAIWAAMAFAAIGDSRRAWELLAMINPINHADTAEAIEKYKVEPYVVAADVYAVTPHTGRGGWTWYTGSAGWMYRLILESLLGFRLEADKLYLSPCLPAEWSGFTADYRFRETVWHIKVIRKQTDEKEEKTVTVDGVLQPGNAINLAAGGSREHSVVVTV